LSDLDHFKGVDMRILWLSISPSLLTHELVPDPAERQMLALWCEALRLFDQPTVTDAEAEEGHQLVLQFGHWLVDVISEAAVRPSTHQLKHIRDVLHNFASLVHSWTLPGERIMRVIKNKNTNNKVIEPQHAFSWLQDDVCLNPEGFLEGMDQMTEQERALHKRLLRGMGFDNDEEDQQALQGTVVWRSIAVVANNSDCGVCCWRRVAQG
jgi:hypothetical protein